jgi:molybdate-binding protein
LVGELPPADALVVASARAGRALVRAIPVEGKARNRLIAAGCDPAMPVLSRYLSKHADTDLITPGCSSTQALTWLRERKIHIAGTHLRDEGRGGSSQAIVARFLPSNSFRIVTFASWEEGWVFAEGNPKRIRGVADLARPDVVLINREVGAGSRFLLDNCLSKEGIPPARVRGYQQTASGHILAAWHVYSGKADCCIATRAAARVFNLGFIPLVNERYDLVIPLRYWDTHAVQATLDALNRSSLRAELEALGGYDTTQTGRLVT